LELNKQRIRLNLRATVDSSMILWDPVRAWVFADISHVLFADYVSITALSTQLIYHTSAFLLILISLKVMDWINHTL
jgi:hypothetical protein